MQQDPAPHSCVDQRQVFAVKVQLSLQPRAPSPAMSTSKSCTGGLVSAPKPQQLYDIHTKTRAWFSCRASCGVATYAPSFPTRAWIWQQVGSDPAAFGHDWFSKAGKAGAALPSPGMPPPSPGLAREDDPAKPFPEPRGEARFKTG